MRRSWSTGDLLVALAVFSAAASFVAYIAVTGFFLSREEAQTGSVGDVDPTWSPDGARLAIASDVGGDFDIYVTNADGTGRALVPLASGKYYKAG